MEIKLTLTPATKAMLIKLPQQFKAGFIKGMKDAMLFAESKAKKNFNRDDDKPKVKTGQLRRSIRSGVKVVPGSNEVIGFVSANTIYAKIQEFGGIIRPRTANLLKFQINGRWVSARQVIIPERPYLRPAIEDNINRIEDIIKDRIFKI